MKILNFGSCNIDYVYTVDHIVTPGETETSDTLSVFPGGKGLNQSIALANAGAEVYCAGCIGTDGEFLRTLMDESRVNTTFLQTINGKTGCAIIQLTTEGENAIFLYPGANHMITKEQVDFVLQHFQEGDILLLQNEINLLDYIIQQGKKAGMQVFLTPAPFNENITNLDLNLIDCLILNQVEAQGLTGCDYPEGILQYFKEHYPKLKVMLTLGKKGCIYQDQNGRYFHPIFRVKTVDTTAAGDTFTGFFATGISQGKDIMEILRIASCASAISVSRNGAAPSIPSMKEVQEQLPILPLNAKDSKQNRIQEKIDAYLSENIQKASLEELSAILGYSTTYTGNLVKSIMGATFKTVLQKKRLELAESLLKNTDLPISDLIHTIGYENESFFRKIFRDTYGKNPLAFRKAHHQ